MYKWYILYLHCAQVNTDGIGPIVGIEIPGSDKEVKKLELGGYIRMSRCVRVIVDSCMVVLVVGLHA